MKKIIKIPTKELVKVEVGKVKVAAYCRISTELEFHLLTAGIPLPP